MAQTTLVNDIVSYAGIAAEVIGAVSVVCAAIPAAAHEVPILQAIVKVLNGIALSNVGSAKGPPAP